MVTRARRAAVAIFLGIVVAGCSAPTPPPVPSPAARVETSPASPGPVPPPSQEPSPDQVGLGTDRPRRSAEVVAAGAADAVYNYAPTLMVDEGRYRMWWCSQLGGAGPPGDDILLGDAPSPDGPYGNPLSAVFSGNPGSFDGMHTCDPSVIRVGGTYYLYYTGAAGNHANGNAIGLATSPDGRTWTRANDGKPIVTSSRDVIRANTYGAGQPAVVHLDGWFYLMFTDTTGKAAGWNGAGQFVIRAKDPTFVTGVELLSPGGFRKANGTADRLRSVVDAFSVDFMWVDALDAFAIAHETQDGTTITFWDRDFRRAPYLPVLIPGPWQEGPGLVRDPEGHSPRSVEAPCDRVPVDLVRATRTLDAPTDLTHFGADLTGTRACADPDRALRALEGYAVPSPQRTIDLIRDGRVVRVERRSVAERLAVRVLDERVVALDTVPVAARLSAAATAVRAGARVGFVLDDDRLWTIPDPAVATLNSSTIATVTQGQFDSYERGPDLAAAR
ncbi:beta-xylosidase [Actinokineospora sp. NBRC 105648]|uniref:beta-xylosidase n=1 Tax=Actinokineospora sp. NBRC 105648 TaxID=3032206 RepID=UPI0024A1F582|nr:beta-xylosidase [Actinokineospora sp. NBRC 105648]GLZ43168.1 beta-xylosidase [Actinokineospora sp. NBRC 105648]